MQKTKREQLNEFINEIAWLEAKLVNQKLQKNLKGHVAGSKSKEEHAKSDLGPEQECESGLPGARKIFKKRKVSGADGLPFELFKVLADVGKPELATICTIPKARTRVPCGGLGGVQSVYASG